MAKMQQKKRMQICESAVGCVKMDCTHLRPHKELNSCILHVCLESEKQEYKMCINRLSRL